VSDVWTRWADEDWNEQQLDLAEEMIEEDLIAEGYEPERRQP
jgi:hypothetical protein